MSLTACNIAVNNGIVTEDVTGAFSKFEPAQIKADLKGKTYGQDFCASQDKTRRQNTIDFLININHSFYTTLRNNQAIEDVLANGKNSRGYIIYYTQYLDNGTSQVFKYRVNQWLVTAPPSDAEGGERSSFSSGYLEVTELD